MNTSRSLSSTAKRLVHLSFLTASLDTSKSGTWMSWKHLKWYATCLRSSLKEEWKETMTSLTKSFITHECPLYRRIISTISFCTFQRFLHQTSRKGENITVQSRLWERGNLGWDGALGQLVEAWPYWGWDREEGSATCFVYCCILAYGLWLSQGCDWASTTAEHEEKVGRHIWVPSVLRYMWQF